MGGYMKGHGTGNNNNGSTRGGILRSTTSYGIIIMVIIGIGAAIIGVMGVHELRERRIFNLLVKDKDRQIFSLHLLLQKERDYAKETKRETQEMKSKLYTLRSQKIDLDSMVLEMQSTISSLKDEQKTMETTLEEKQNELKLLREKEMEFVKENAKLISLSETLKQKEAEIEELKNRIGAPVKVWSVVTDDPSNPPVNLTLTRTNETNSTSSGNVSKGEEEDSRKLEHSIEGSRKDVEVLERKENGTQGRGNNYRVRKGKGKRWRGIEKKGNLEGNEVVSLSLRGKRFIKDAFESERKKRNENGLKMNKTEEQNEGDKRDLVVDNTRNGEKSEESKLVSKSFDSNDRIEGERLKVGEKMRKKVEEKKMKNEKVKGKVTEEDENVKVTQNLELTRSIDVDGKQKLGEVGIEEKNVDDEETEESDV